MDMEKVILKFKKNAKGTHSIAYCDEYPELQGIGPTEGHAVANFWKAFNNAENKHEHEAAIQRKNEKLNVENQQNKKKKVA